jgi:hypothetical protein
MEQVARYAKAIVGFATPIITLLATRAFDADPELQALVVPALTGFLVYLVPNAPGRAHVSLLEGEPEEGGTTTLGTPVDTLDL